MADAATDADDDPAFWSLAQAPRGAVVEPASGRVRSTPEDFWAGKTARFSL